MKNLLLILSICVLSLMTVGSVQATISPEYFVVSWKLINEDLLPRQWSFYFRTSLWPTANANDNDPTNITGSLWSEKQLITLEADGSFAINMGTMVSLPALFSFDYYKFLQIDLYPSNMTEDDYFQLDPLWANNLIDRINLLTVPFKYNSSTVQWRILWYGSGNIPYLDQDWKLPNSTVANIVTTTLTSIQSQIQDIVNENSSSVWQEPVNDANQLYNLINPRI